MSDKSFTLKKNAVRAARKLMANGKARAPSFAIKTAAGGSSTLCGTHPRLSL